MSLIDAAIPGVIGVVLVLWPRLAFVGSRAAPDEKKIRVIRLLGAGLVCIALLLLGVGRSTA